MFQENRLLNVISFDLWSDICFLDLWDKTKSIHHAYYKGYIGIYLEMWSPILCNLCIGKIILYPSQRFTMYLQMWINVFQGFLPVEALISEIEVWGLGGKAAKEVQSSYKKREELFTEQRRKVTCLDQIKASCMLLNFAFES